LHSTRVEGEPRCRRARHFFATAIAVAIVAAALTFGNGLDSLVSHPALYGWNWDYALTSSQDVPPQLLGMLARDPDVQASSGIELRRRASSTVRRSR
jgi:hypothetical protein